MDFEACWAFSIIAEQTHSNSKRICSWKFPIGHFGAFSQSRHIQSACLLRSSLLGILRPFRKAFRAFFLFEVPYWASCGLFAEQTHSKRLSSSKLPVGNLAAFSQSIQSVFPLRSSLLGILRPFRRADTFKALVFFEAPCWESCGLFAKHSERFSSSKFPIGHLAAFSQSRHIQSACLLRSSLLGILRPFRRADTFQKILFEVPYWASWGLFAKQTHSKCFCFSKLPVGNLGASSQSRRIQSGFRLRIFLGPSRRADTFKTLLLFEVPNRASWALSQSRHIRNAFLLRSSLLGILAQRHFWVLCAFPCLFIPLAEGALQVRCAGRGAVPALWILRQPHPPDGDICRSCVGFLKSAPCRLRPLKLPAVVAKTDILH